MKLSHRLAIAFFFVLSGCSHKPVSSFDNIEATESACTTVKFPTDAEFRAMRLSELYPWYQSTKRAQDLIAQTAALNGPDPGPCIKVAAFKGYTIIHEAMKYAY